MNYKGINFLKKQLFSKRNRVRMRYRYYEMKNGIKDFKIAIPNEFKYVSETLGWCSKAVDSLADRISFKEFENDNFNMNDIFNMNNKDILTDSAILGALIASCSFIYISQDEDGYPRLQVIDAYDATGIIDPITNMMIEGYAVLERDEKYNILSDTYFTCEETVVFDYAGHREIHVPNPARYCLLVPVIHKPDAKRQFGHSRISRACIDLQQGALRTLRRSEVAAEFYSYPQKYILGTDSDADPMDKIRASISTMLQISRSEDGGGTPTVGQFAQQSMSPHIDQLKSFASLFAGETGLTLDDLGFVTDNPSSAEAIKAAHENLRLAARKAQKNFATSLINVGYLAASVRDGFGYYRNQIYETTVKYEPLFEPDMSTLSLIGDGAIKINQAVPGYFNKDNLQDLTGIASSKLDVPTVPDDEE